MKSKQTPTVSVLMPIYKTKPTYLKATIQSILNQTFKDFEFLILDDCPSDTREDVVKSFKDERIIYTKNKENLGITPSRNKLVQMAKGQYLAVMDHDDISLPERFEKQVAFLQKHPRVGVVGCQYQMVPNGRQSRLPITDTDIKTGLMQDCMILHPSSMIRACVLKKDPYKAEFSPSEDYALWCDLIDKTDFYNIPEILFHYHLHEANTSKTQSQKMQNTAQKIRDIVRQKHPKLWQNFQQNAPHIVRMKLFGLIPLGKFIQQGCRKKGPLKYLPFITTKIKYKHS